METACEVMASESEYSLWIQVCKSVAENTDGIDKVIVMSGEAKFKFDAADENPVTLSDEIASQFEKSEFDNVMVSGVGFSCVGDIFDHTNTKEIRAMD